METVLISSVKVGKSGVSKQNKPWTQYMIILGDGRDGSSFDRKFLELQGQTVPVEVTQNGKWLNFSLPEEAKENTTTTATTVTTTEESPSASENSKQLINATIAIAAAEALNATAISPNEDEQKKHFKEWYDYISAIVK